MSNRIRCALATLAVALVVPFAAPAAQSPGPAAPTTLGLSRDAAIAAALAEISPARLRAMDSVLVGFGTRHTLSDTVSATRGIGATRRWIHAQLSQYARDCGGCLRVEYDTGSAVITRHPDRPTWHLVNVVAWLPGRDTSRVVVIGGHMDSCVCSANSMDAVSDAPGADDDGSGTVAVMELARVVSSRFPRGFDASIAFILYTGEEMGLLGSTNFAARLQREGKAVTAAFTDDMVGNVSAEDGRVDTSTVRVFAVDSLALGGTELARYVWAVGALYQPSFEVLPVFRLDRIGRGGDHAPFHRLGHPALRFSERSGELHAPAPAGRRDGARGLWLRGARGAAQPGDGGIAGVGAAATGAHGLAARPRLGRPKLHDCLGLGARRGELRASGPTDDGPHVHADRAGGRSDLVPVRRESRRRVGGRAGRGDQRTPVPHDRRRRRGRSAAPDAAVSAFSRFTPEALRFLRDLKRNNHKPWFETHRATYERAVLGPLRQLAEELDVRFARLAPEFVAPPKRALFRIHRDVRFSRDKSPYKTHAALWVFHRDAGRGVGREAHGGAGFYFHIEPGASLVAGGYWMPPRPALARIREAIVEKQRGFEKIVRAPAFVRAFEALSDDDPGAVLKRTPRGYSHRITRRVGGCGSIPSPRHGD